MSSKMTSKTEILSRDEATDAGKIKWLQKFLK